MEVLRAWERRFGFPRPERRPGSNRRLYTQADVARLIAIRHALDAGYRIGDVIEKSLPELEMLGPSGTTSIVDATSAPPRTVAEARDLIVLLRANEIERVEDALLDASSRLGPKRFVTDVAHPFAVAVGEAWASGDLSIRHEHMATECITTRLRQILSTYRDVDAAPVVLLATLPGELHTLSLQMVAVYVAAANAKPRLLGASTPPAEILQAANTLGAGVVGLTVTPTCDLAEARRAVRTLRRDLPPKVTLWIGGSAASSLDLDSETAQIVSTWRGLDEALDEARRSSDEPTRGAR